MATPKIKSSQIYEPRESKQINATTGLTINLAINGALFPDTAFHIHFASPVLGMACIAIETDSHKRRQSANDKTPKFVLSITGKENIAPIKVFKKKGPAEINTS